MLDFPKVYSRENYRGLFVGNTQKKSLMVQYVWETKLNRFLYLITFWQASRKLKERSLRQWQRNRRAVESSFSSRQESSYPLYAREESEYKYKFKGKIVKSVPRSQPLPLRLSPQSHICASLCPPHTHHADEISLHYFSSRARKQGNVWEVIAAR